MSDQVEPGSVGSVAAGPGPAGLAQQAAFVPQTPGTPVAYPTPFHGRAVSWVAVSLIMVGFLVGGFALIFGPTWWMFWLGLGLAGVGGLTALAINIFEDWY
ncbi:MAG TPA: hypothetical protein VMF87_33540 [Streptosporangiaceae bacterium]|nr:hypothetical protein [Streptosporangiaceae bacterium]